MQDSGNISDRTLYQMREVVQGAGMMCYKDMTFCAAWRLCEDGDKCPLALTDYVVEQAKKERLDIAHFSGNKDCLRLKK
jgi:hypothetical protein